MDDSSNAVVPILNLPNLKQGQNDIEVAMRTVANGDELLLLTWKPWSHSKASQRVRFSWHGDGIGGILCWMGHIHCPLSKQTLKMSHQCYQNPSNGAGAQALREGFQTRIGSDEDEKEGGFWFPGSSSCILIRSKAFFFRYKAS
jgi:hypothetical protein